MGIDKFIKKVCVQTAVYWGSPTKDGYGTMTYDDPIEVQCRWAEKQSIVIGTDGKERVSKAEILVTEDLDIQGLLYLGYLTDIEDYYESNGTTIDLDSVDDVFEIIAFNKVPMIKSRTVYVRTAFI